MPKNTHSYENNLITVREIHQKLLQICSHPQIWSGLLVKGPLIYGIGHPQGGSLGGLDTVYVLIIKFIF